MIYNYRFKCITEDLWVTNWSEFDELQCPNNPGHFIDSTNAIVIESVRKDNVHIVFGSDTNYYYQCTTGEWELIRGFVFKGSKLWGSVKACSLTAKAMNSSYPGNYRLYDVTNNNIICTWEITNDEQYTKQVVLDPSNIPDSEAEFEIHGKSYDNNVEHLTSATSFMMEFVGG